MGRLGEVYASGFEPNTAETKRQAEWSRVHGEIRNEVKDLRDNQGLSFDQVMDSLDEAIQELKRSPKLEMADPAVVEELQRRAQTMFDEYFARDKFMELTPDEIEKIQGPPGEKDPTKLKADLRLERLGESQLPENCPQEYKDHWQEIQHRLIDRSLHHEAHSAAQEGLGGRVRWLIGKLFTNRRNIADSGGINIGTSVPQELMQRKFQAYEAGKQSNKPMEAHKKIFQDSESLWKHLSSLEYDEMARFMGEVDSNSSFAQGIMDAIQRHHLDIAVIKDIAETSQNQDVIDEAQIRLNQFHSANMEGINREVMLKPGETKAGYFWRRMKSRWKKW